MNTEQFDSILGPVASEFSHEADTILDLRTAALREKDAGLCLRCFFKIRAQSTRSGAPVRARTRLDPLREWMERNIEIVARGDDWTELERVPLVVEGEDLETFCHGVMREFQENRAYTEERIEISVAFKGPARTDAA